MIRLLLLALLLALGQLMGNGDGEAMGQWSKRHPEAFVC